MYDRRIGDRVLSFEASGALKSASLVLRDRETDSWWSIMTSSAIGGELDGTRLVELPVGAKTTWAEWRAAHPDTRVLSVDGREHEPHDGYATYWTSERTFRDLEVADDRLPPKEPIFAFTLDGRAFAVPHRLLAGGRIFELGAEAGRIFLHRDRGASIRASSEAFLVPSGFAGPATAVALAAAGAERLAGFDTYWYSWVAIHPATQLTTR